MNNNSEKDLFNLAKRAALNAGDALMEIYNQSYEISHKHDNSPVTCADLASEKEIIKILEPTGIPILSEETEDNLSRLDAKRVWIVDPLDGTKDFIQKTDDFTVMIGLVEQGRPVLGLVYHPVSGTLYYGKKGEGAFLERGGNIDSLQVSQCDVLSRARLLISRNHLLPLEKKVAEELGIKSLIPSGSAGLKICLLAAGEAEIYINSSNKTHEWDICAAEVILEEAGGVLRDLEGNNFVFNKRDTKNYRGYVATISLLLQQVLFLVK